MLQVEYYSTYHTHTFRSRDVLYYQYPMQGASIQEWVLFESRPLNSRIRQLCYVLSFRCKGFNFTFPPLSPCSSQAPGELTSSSPLFSPEEMEDFTIDINDFRMAEEIGHGSFGVVHRGVIKNFEAGGLVTEVAVKRPKGKSA